MVQAVVRHYAEKTADKILSDALFDILDTPVTPELLPISERGELLQKSEDSVGPYSLQDFFLYHMLMRGTDPKKLIRISEYVFKGEYDRKTLVKWLLSYSRRLFIQQFKRSTTADGPEQMGFTFSPRTGYKMPSDAESTLWLKALDEIKL
jgi:NAD+ synthase (glutamine-hydrolysing)